MTNSPPDKVNLWQRLRRRGVVRVAISYLVIGWLVLQIGDVVLDPIGAPPWAMRLLIVLVALGFPIALALAWFLEFTPTGIEVDQLDETAARPTLRGVRRYGELWIIGFLLLVVAFLLIRQEGLIPQERAPPVVAILPFEELDSSEDNHFGDGFADTLIQKLGVLDQLVVLASSSTFEFRDTGPDLTDVAAKLGATVLLQGSMRRAGGLLRLDARLVDGSTSQQLWSGNFRRPIEDVFRLQDEIANAIASTLGVELSASQVARIAKPPTGNVAAYDTFLRASREILESRDNLRMTEALQYLYDAIELDPDFALAHATLVEALFLTASYRSWDTAWADVAEEARAATARAQALDPSLAEAYYAEALVAYYDDQFGLRELSVAEIRAPALRALELNPNLARVLKFLGPLEEDPERQLEMLQRAAQMDPRSAIIAMNVAEVTTRLGRFNEAEDWSIRAARAREPFFGRGYKKLVEINLFEAGRLDRAARWGRAFESTHPEDWASKLGFLEGLFQLGAWDEANELLELTGRFVDDPFMTWIYTHTGQWLAYAQGDTEKAVYLAERTIREFVQTTPDWPDLSGVKNTIEWNSFELLALVDLSLGEPQNALDRYLNANLDPEQMDWANFYARTIRPRVMHAVLHRHVGQDDEADRLLRDALAQVKNEPIGGSTGKGFMEFTIHAFLGDTDAAIAALEAVVVKGWLPGWWGLEHGAFDSNYAAVLDDPRYSALHEQIVGRVREMRESFRANPDLPAEVLLEAGLATP